jgi:hypothetical protein
MSRKGHERCLGRVSAFGKENLAQERRIRVNSSPCANDYQAASFSSAPAGEQAPECGNSVGDRIR